jgi:opacity protein-like surface antigen
MLRHALLLALCLLAGCASTEVSAHYAPAPRDSAQYDPALDARATVDAWPPAATTEHERSSTLDFAALAAESMALDSSGLSAFQQQQPQPVVVHAPPPPPPPHPRSRITLKGGYYGADEDELDDGWIAALSWMQFLAPFFATEFEIGYLDVDGEEGAISTDVWGLPVMFNGRFNLPLGQRFEAFGGAGFGSIYFEGEADGPFVDVEADGWLTAGDLFAGAALTLRNAMTLGVEWKWYFTDSDSELDSGLDANAVMLTLGFNR